MDWKPASRGGILYVDQEDVVEILEAYREEFKKMAKEMEQLRIRICVMEGRNQPRVNLDAIPVLIDAPTTLYGERWNDYLGVIERVPMFQHY